MSIFTDIEAELLALQDEKFAELEHRTAPTLEREHFIGVRTPDLRKLAKELRKREDICDFLGSLPHRRFEEAFAKFRALAYGIHAVEIQ